VQQQKNLALLAKFCVRRATAEKSCFIGQILC
jgi:hypothetical protein